MIFGPLRGFFAKINQKLGVFLNLVWRSALTKSLEEDASA
jgi:hypothetical protein